MAEATLRGRVLFGRRAIVWLPILILPPFFLWALQAAHRVLPTEEVIELTQARFQSTSTYTEAPLPVEGWRDMPLPHQWRSDHREVRHAVYRIPLDLEVAPDRLWGVFVPRHAMTSSIFVNGERAMTGGSHNSPMARHWNRPLLVSIPNGLLRPGNNEILVRVSSEPAGSGLLRELYAGPYESLAAYQRWHEILRGSVPLTITVLLATMGLFMSVLWWVRRQDTIYLWYALALLTWATHGANLLAVNIPFAAWIWEWLRYTSFGWVSLLTAIFVHRFLGERHPRLERVIVAVGILGSLMLFLVALQDETMFNGKAIGAWYAVSLGAGCVTAWRFGLHLLRHPNAESSLLLSSGAIMLLCGARDWLVFTGVLPRWDGLFINYTALPVMLVFGVILFRRFVGALGEAENLNVHLERRVADKHRELADNYERMRELERLKLLADERARIMRDMHDGVGGHMISTVALIEAGQTTLPDIAASMRAAIEDLRLMIDSLDPDIDSVPTALRLIRSRLEPRMRQAGVALIWQVEELPGLKLLNPQATLNLMRIVQEAIHNALRHAGATELTVSVASLSTAQRSTSIEVRDNGRGMPTTVQQGRGLNNMRKRAQILGADIEIQSSERGTCVLLSI